MKTPPRSPPGFPSPLYPASPGIVNIPVGLELSPQSANVTALAAAFNDADLHEDEEMQIWAIKDIEDGEVEHDNDGNMNYYLDNGRYYQCGHGRARCSHEKCSNRDQYDVKDFPNNCGFHPQWRLPDKFEPCGDDCQGGLCPCLGLYAPGYEIYRKMMKREIKKK